ncbi:MAG: N-acetylglucosamine-6-phosphate deacetylase [Xanthomonadales bacterium]|nr:N-acetylglucosamine-6-phosphate deacetylase [Xanthomonadales bacterium]
MKKALINCHVFDGLELHTGLAVLLEGNRISALLAETDIPESVTQRHDLAGNILAPGLIDIQVNGGGGVMFNDAPSVETIRRIGAVHRSFGTTGFLPTLISSDFDTMKLAIEAVGQAISEGVPGVLGIHLEGPFLNADKRGIHNAERFCQLDEPAFEMLTSMTGGRTLVTIAPEKVSTEMISRLTRQGVLVFGGHSAATYEQAHKALQAGMRGFTHVFNAMSPFEARAPGMVGAALHDRQSWVGMIADGQHVHPASFAVAVAAKRKGYSLLVTDAMATVGSDTTAFSFDGNEITAADGCCRTASGLLAGSNLDMISAVRNTTRFAGLNPSEALRMASSYPAEALGLEKELGYIRPGFRASFIEVDENLNLFRTWIDGDVSG